MLGKRMEGSGLDALLNAFSAFSPEDLPRI